ncbi:MAG TPA: enolase C-terminal domain-like protein [Pseudolabrys sp.]|nr:enolase C-terminal domain-like protein [Pseudolabrys sp.]
MDRARHRDDGGRVGKKAGMIGVQIKTVEPIAISLPMRKPVIMAGEEVRRADNVLVRIESDTGLVGWGEAASAPVMTGETLESIVSAVHYLGVILRGRDPADIGGALAAMESRMYGNHGAKAAIEIALHDLVGLITGKPVHALLGDKTRSRVPLLGVIGGGDFAGDLRDAESKKAAGVTAYKIKVGIDTPENDAARTRAICRVLGKDLLISADANQGFDVEQALVYVRAVKGSGLDFFEQPVAADNLDGMAEVSAATDIAIGADEGIHSLDDIRRHHERKAARGVSLKAIKLGGIRAVAEAGILCDRLGMNVNISCKTGESSVACAAALHVASVIPNIDWALTLTHGGLAEDITARPLPIGQGYAESLDRPGLGVDVDEDRVRRHRVQIAARSVA